MLQQDALIFSLDGTFCYICFSQSRVHVLSSAGTRICIQGVSKYEKVNIKRNQR